MDELQALIDALTNNRDSAPAQTPDPAALFAGIEDDTLATMEVTAQEAGAALQQQRLTEETVAQLEVLADTCAAIRAEIDRREAASAELSARAAEYSARINPAGITAADEEGGDEEQDAEDEGGESTTTAASVAPVTPAQPPVARTRPRVDLSQISRATPANSPAPRGGIPRQSAQPTSTVTAAADLPGYQIGAQITSVDELSRAVAARFGSFPIGSNNVEVRGGIAVIKRNFPSELVASGQKGNDEEMLEYASDERRLPGGSLAASMLMRAQTDMVRSGAGSQGLDSLVAALSPNAALPGAINSVWCAPYEIDTTLCDPLETLDGFYDLPTVGVRPPGVIYTQNMDWWRLFFDMSAVPPTPQNFDEKFQESLNPCFTKTCIEVPCPDWTQADVGIEPFCIESCILKERANQSWYDWFVKRALTAFRRWQNVQVIEKVLAMIAAQPGTSTVSFLPTGGPPPTASFPYNGAWGTAHTTLDSLSLLVTWYRDLYRMNMNATMEVVAPHWVKNVIRDDMAKRFGCGCQDVTDAQIMSWFANRGMRVQWIYDWQTLVATADLAPLSGNVPGSNPTVARQVRAFPAVTAAPPPPTGIPTPIKSYPTSFDVLVYPAGTFVSGRVEMFRLDGLYDSANLKQNKYTKIFFEDGVTVMQRCYRAFRATLPVCTTGGNFFAHSFPTPEVCQTDNTPA